MKKLKYLVLVVTFMFLCTGCVKFNANMDIKKDKSMDFTIIYALDSTYFGNKESVNQKNQKELRMACCIRLQTPLYPHSQIP